LRDSNLHPRLLVALGPACSSSMPPDVSEALSCRPGSARFPDAERARTGVA
jgi:hypothetical protein